ncbi:LuxR C-terminal-related transcriptional regulator [Dactylosporangium sucinum]|uniref:Helix-turn-helix transcriptional regulator n=1 Tax=Dactylosporangium sucinum TaxID=1424081 RepID=A0A917U321_9ACTN|nr:helix-turn-helix transcriptional regulator [Dactylosporangium sucinum]GGM51354.1 helix-turn-helix transcriptional regulator [Dactylosporangium sucinum]
MVDTAALERIRRIADAATDSRALRSAALAEIGRVVPFAAYVWPLTDPETSVATAPLAAIPPALMPGLPRLIRLKYLTAVNRWTGLSGAARLEVPEQSLFWRELLRDQGVTDVASAVLRDRYGCWAFLDLWRCGGTFTRDELAFLDEVAALLTEPIRRCEAATFSATTAARDPAPVVLLLDPDLRVLGQTSPTREYLARLLPPPADLEPVPAAAYNVAAQLVAVEEGVDGQPPTARVHLAGGRWLTLRAARIGADAQIAVTVADSSPADRTAVFARACGLAAREAELLQHLTTGADTRTVAARMFLSEHTVQDHLKSIFAKTGTRSRRVLLSRAAGTA